VERFKKMGVFLTGATVDDAVLGFAAQMSRLDVEQIYCIRVRDDAPFGDKDLPNASEIEQTVRQVFSPEAADRTTCEVRDGSRLVETLKAARDKNMDLIVIGRDLPSSQIGVRQKITRIVMKSPCSVLVVPEIFTPHFDRIMVAVGGTRHSKLALEAGAELARASSASDPQLLAVTVRSVDPQHDLAGVTFEQAASAQREYGERDMAALLADVDMHGIKLNSKVVLSDEPARALAHVVMAMKMDVLVMGSRGATGPTAVLLGSKTEDVLQSCALPMLVVKEKGETLRLLEALFAMDS
jgi:nucleotide-binding universal stress UspA family protein